jgi:hypothetical protein
MKYIVTVPIYVNIEVDVSEKDLTDADGEWLLTMLQRANENTNHPL